MAEISVPAWPIPIQKTNVVMYTLQNTGGLYPACPSPSFTRMRKVRIPTRRSDIAPNSRTTYPRVGGPNVATTSRVISAWLWVIVWPSWATGWVATAIGYASAGSWTLAR
jgi:hypothetical protein